MLCTNEQKSLEFLVLNVVIVKNTETSGNPAVWYGHERTAIRLMHGVR